MFFKRNKNQVGGIAYQHVNAYMVTNIKLDTAELVKSINELKEALCGTTEQPKIHELPERSKTIHVSGLLGYYNIIDSPKAIALLDKPNTRLAIIEDDHA
ncbi:MAG: hypothetical protein LKJ39_12165 [Liquorilactobacillus nagelii]|jgi:hypothetical protein|uniref:hypothetical protein n=1 Tax=Liquorilactobacillus nagelii TaxID=82688 RepID=UPI00242A8DBF|nr:hypothetical protein [Liquorilactobacillus nagelii]MCI1978052.1 hypothetical protein [Liquorilactobacillus nagelii]